MSSRTIASRAELDDLFFELAKTYRKLAKKNAVKLEMILIGGASILLNYRFRTSTSDVDALVMNSATLKEAIRIVALNHHLDRDWLNTDFERTSSYTPKLIEHSRFYKSYLGLIDVRTIKDEHLIAMKLKASRDYKYDLSDVVGILVECRQQMILIDKALVEKAVTDLYGSIDAVSQEAWDHLDLVINHPNLDFLYEAIREMEAAYYKARLLAAHPNKGDGPDNTNELLELLNER